MNPAIVIPCYNRPESLARLLHSIGLADYGEYSGSVTLVFSIDYSGSDVVQRVAEQFEWKHGRRSIIAHEENLGLRSNILFCGDLTEEYGSVIVLEDDLVVSPVFYKYATAALDFYEKDPAIAQISLYAYEYSEIASERFHPLYNGFDAYFMQWVSSWGQLWTVDQWKLFRDWYDSHKEGGSIWNNVPLRVRKWTSSWKKYFIAYLVAKGKYVVYPYHGFSTCFGDTGEHCRKEEIPVIQSPLAFGTSGPFKFTHFKNSHIRYDVYFQPEKRMIDLLIPELAAYDYIVDFHATKFLDDINVGYMISTRECLDPIYSFSWNIFPLELNLFYRGIGSDIFFGRVEMFKENVGMIRKIRLGLWGRRLPSLLMIMRMFMLKMSELFKRSKFF